MATLVTEAGGEEERLRAHWCEWVDPADVAAVEAVLATVVGETFPSDMAPDLEAIGLRFMVGRVRLWRHASAQEVAAFEPMPVAEVRRLAVAEFARRRRDVALNLWADERRMIPYDAKRALGLCPWR